MGKAAAWIAGSSVICAVTLMVVLVFEYPDFDPVEITVEEVSLGRLALAAPAAKGKPASLAYNLSLAVAVRNPNWVIRVWRTAPLEAELRLGGTPFAVVRLAGAAEEREELIRPKRSAVSRAAAVAESEPVALGVHGAAELAGWKRVTGLVNLELSVAGEVRYEAHSRPRSFTVSCSLRLPLSTAPMAVAVARFEHTLPQACVYV